jgi:hypothetical protein
VMKSVPFSGSKIGISGLTRGIYLVTLVKDGEYFQGKVVKE